MGQIELGKPLAIEKTPIPGFLRIDLTVHGDNRGWFKENWQREKMLALGLPDFAYSPDPDGEADPGEVVWAWVPFEEDPAQGKDRPVLVLARHETRLVVAQMTSKDHDRDAAQEARWGRFWHDVGTGDWDRQGRPSEVRLDRLLLVEPASVRREGATMKREVFDGVVAALRHHHS